MLTDRSDQPFADKMPERRSEPRIAAPDWDKRLRRGESFNFRVALRRETGEYVGLCKEIPRLAYADYDPRRALTGVKDLVEQISRMINHQGLRRMS